MPERPYKAENVKLPVYDALSLAQETLINLGKEIADMAYSAHCRDDIKKSQKLQDIAARLTIDRLAIPEELKFHKLDYTIWVHSRKGPLPRERRLDNVRYLLDTSILAWSNEELPGPVKFWVDLMCIADAIVVVQVPGAKAHSTPRPWIARNN